MGQSSEVQSGLVFSGLGLGGVDREGSSKLGHEVVHPDST